MSTTDIGAVRAALAAAAQDVDGVTRALAYMPASVALDDLPLVIVGNPESITYNRTFGLGRATILLRVTALVSLALDAEAGTALLDDFVSQQFNAGNPASLAAALRQERSTDEEQWVAAVRSADNYGLVKVESTDYFGVQLVVEVTT